jgi:predicted nuclease with TOPRIM domain
MTSTRDEFERAILEKISEDKELLAKLAEVPAKIEKTVEELTPVLTGETVKSIEVKSRRSELKKLSTRRTRLGEVYSDEDPAKVNAIEFGRGADDDNGPTPEFAMFRRAAARWQDARI